MKNDLLDLNDDEYLVSFCVPIYKYPVTDMTKCIDSILNCGLDKNDYEIIIISDGNTKSFNDELDNLLTFYTQMHGINVKTVLHLRNSGLFEARKSGVRMSRGKYICHVDCDDTLEENCLSDLNEFISNSKTEWDIIQYKYDTIFHKETRSTPKIYTNYKTRIEENSLLRLCIVEDGIPRYIWGKLIKRDIYKRILDKMPEMYINFAEDFLALVFLTTYSKTYIYRENIKMYNYYRTDDTMTSHVNKMGKNKWDNLLSVAKVIEITKPDNFKDPDIKKCISKVHEKYALELYSLLTLEDIFESDDVKKYAIDSFAKTFGANNAKRIEKAFKYLQQHKDEFISTK